MIQERWGIVLSSLFAAVCCGAEFEYTAIQNVDESLLAQQAQIEDSLVRRGVVVESPDLQSVGRAIINQLTSTDRSLPAIRIVDTEQVNAFTLPNGDIYLNAALLVRLKRSEDLAFVLLHEWAHHLRGDLRLKLSMTPGDDAWQAMELQADEQAIEWLQDSQWSTASVTELIRRLYQSSGPRMLSQERRLESVPAPEQSLMEAWQPQDDRLNRARQMALTRLLRRGSFGGLTEDEARSLMHDSGQSSSVQLIRQTAACAQSFRQAHAASMRLAGHDRLDRWRAQAEWFADQRPAASRSIRRAEGTATLPVNYRLVDRLLWTMRGPHLDAMLIEPLNAPDPRCQADDWVNAAVQALRQGHPDHDLTELSVQNHPSLIELAATLTDSAGLNWRVRDLLVELNEDWFRLRMTSLEAIDAGKSSMLLEDLRMSLMQRKSGFRP